MEEFDKQCLTQEIQVLSELRHEHIIRLHDVFDSDDHVRLVLEMVNGGELLDRLIQKTNYTEREARDVCKIVMEAIHHCHEHKIAHRDLKPENLLLTVRLLCVLNINVLNILYCICCCWWPKQTFSLCTILIYTHIINFQLLKSSEDDTTIKIADFGFAKHCPHDEGLKTQCGSAQHVAPEILKNVPYGTKVDMWALGVIHYTLTGGCPPFYAQTNQETFQKILKANVVFDDHLWGHVHEDCKEMIRG